jgi:nickel/cobalt transporter (NicO) family protein
MRRLIWVPAALAILAGVWLWGYGGADRVAMAAANGQQQVQNGMAQALRALKAGDMGALVTLWALCFGYGFFHAAGPGHGKLVIGGYGLGRRVPMGRLAGLAVASSLAQAATAIILVYAGVLILGWSRETMQGLADQGLNTLSNALIAGIGLWLLWRGALVLWKARHDPVPVTHAPVAIDDTLYGLGSPLPDHVHTEGAVCETCGHAHGPTLEQAEQVRSLRDAVIVVGAIAARPCTGAIFLLILTWRIGIDWAGIIGAFVMGLGTATITVAVAMASVSFRESALMQVAAGPATARVLGVIEVMAGALVLAIAVQLLIRGY